MRYKCWRSNKDKEVHLICAEGSEAFEALPAAIRSLGPWTGSREGEIAQLRLPYRVLIAEQGFALLHCHVSKLALETATVHTLHPANTECPECKGTGEVDQHGGLRKRSCLRCGGRGWIGPRGR